MTRGELPFLDGRATIVAESLLPGDGGIARVARLMLTALSQRSATSVNAISLTNSPRDRNVAARNPLVRLLHRARFMIRVANATRDTDVVLYDFAGMARAHTLVRRDIPMACWMHGIEAWDNARPTRLKWLKRADVLLVNSHYTLARASALHGHFPQARVCLLATECDDPPHKSALSVRPTVLTVGRMNREHQYKGHDELLGAWPIVLSKVPTAILVVVGTGDDQPRLIQKSIAMGLADSVHFKGFLDDDQLDREWSSAWVFAMPSAGEGFGLVYIEAMRHALPVVASRCDAGQEVSPHGISGLNTDRDPLSIADAISRLLLDTQLRTQLSFGAFRRWKEEFTMSAFSRRFLGTLEAGLINAPSRKLT